MKKLFVFFLILFFASPLLAATETFYVCDGGDGTLPETATCATAWDCDDLDTGGNWDTDDADDGLIGPNDEVQIMDEGGKLRCDIDFSDKQSGLSGKPITITNYTGDIPIFSGFDDILSQATTCEEAGDWTEEADGRWYCDEAYLSTEPLVVVFNGSQKGYTAETPAAEYDWDWDAGTPNKLYVFTAAGDNNPTAYYSSIEISQRNAVFNINLKDYITFDGITAEGANDSGENGGYHIRGGSDHIIIQNCISRWNNRNGYRISDTAGANNVIQDSIAYGNRVGAMVYRNNASNGNENIIRRNTLYDNWHSGIWSSGSYVIVAENKIYDNGVLDSDCSKYNGGSGSCDGSGIKSFGESGVDSARGNYHTIYNNIIYNTLGDAQDGSGILTDVYSDHNEIYGNVVYNNDGACIAVWLGQDTNIYNNSCYKNSQDSFGASTVLSEIRLNDNGTNRTTNINIKNNAVYADDDAGDYAIYIHSNLTDATISIDTNLWYKDSGDWWYYGTDGAGSDRATWNAKALVGTDLNSDPLFIDKDNHNFTLQPGSPAINDKTNIGATRAVQLLPPSNLHNKE